MHYVLSLLTIVLGLWACSPGAEVANYGEMKAQFFAERDKQEPPAEVKKTMADAAAQLKMELPQPGLTVGSMAPDFNLINAHGKRVSLKDTLKKGPAIVVFYRGAWCPYCNLYLRSLKDSLPAFRQKNAQLLAITPQKPDFSLKQVKDDKLGFEVLSDLDYQVIKKYNLYFELPPKLEEIYRQFGIDLVKYNGTGRIGLPVAATFVIGQDGKVKVSSAPHDYKERLEPAEILKAL